MIEQILSLLVNYSLKNKIADRYFIEQIISIVVGEKEIKQYVKNLEVISDITDKALARYYLTTKKIQINEVMFNRFLRYNDRFITFFSAFEITFFQNVLIMQIILHELEHARQWKTIEEETTDNFEKQLLQLSRPDFSEYKNSRILVNDNSLKQTHHHCNYETKSVRNYNDNYKICPWERLAEIKSIREIIGMLKLVEKDVPNLLEFETTNLLEQFLRGYKGTEQYFNSPTLFYLLNNGIEKEDILNISWLNSKYISSLSLSQRMKYGLPINCEEENSLMKVLKKTKKYQQFNH